ncbi:uncharacterized protein EV422DRAFT_224599 [Fimicolochytrium jonesii]|uniref:uncharacterized protein n=1 Tax=Fimicolochytrium jonesii TaxID=1396493 RepID=UPI0022FE6B64|nr:uncharacterized protein EV422DRAFT_224599 [Fimicolochytrium jonesii]KAI8817425.1 hypothetical protein EV422DRAFT_224599 [Fimicolochytrium jonesii]
MKSLASAYLSPTEHSPSFQMPNTSTLAPDLPDLPEASREFEIDASFANLAPTSPAPRSTNSGLDNRRKSGVSTTRSNFYELPNRDSDGGRLGQLERHQSPSQSPMATQSSMRVGNTGALRRGVRRTARRGPSVSKLSEEETGGEQYEEDIGIPSWAEHRSAGEVVLYGRITEGVVMLMLLLGSFILINYVSNAVLPTQYGPSILHGALAIAGYCISSLGGKMVTESIHHALTIIALTRGADCYIMSSNYQTRNPFILSKRALFCCLQNAKDTKSVELVRLSLIVMMLILHLTLSGILSFAMVSIEWVEIASSIGTGTCEKGVYTPILESQRQNIHQLASSVSPAIFVDTDGSVGVISSLLPKTATNVQVTGTGAVVKVLAPNMDETAEPCTSDALTNSSYWGLAAVVCDREYHPTTTGAQLFLRLGLPVRYCSGCVSHSSYQYFTVSGEMQYFTGTVTAEFAEDVSAISRAGYVSHGDLVSGVDSSLAANFMSIWNRTTPILLVGTFQARQPAIFNSIVNAQGQYTPRMTEEGMARGIASLFETTMMSFTSSSDYSCDLKATQGYGHGVISGWLPKVFGTVAVVSAVVVIGIMLEARKAVKELQPHAYARGLSIMKDPLRFMVSMKDCRAFWERTTGGCDASGDLLRNASAGLICKYGEEKATRSLETGHLMFGAPEDVIPIRDGREYSGPADGRRDFYKSLVSS